MQRTRLSAAVGDFPAADHLSPRHAPEDFAGRAASAADAGADRGNRHGHPALAHLPRLVLAALEPECGNRHHAAALPHPAHLFRREPLPQRGITRGRFLRRGALRIPPVPFEISGHEQRRILQLLPHAF